MNADGKARHARLQEALGLTPDEQYEAIKRILDQRVFPSQGEESPTFREALSLDISEQQKALAAAFTLEFCRAVFIEAAHLMRGKV